MQITGMKDIRRVRRGPVCEGALVTECVTLESRCRSAERGLPTGLATPEALRDRALVLE